MAVALPLLALACDGGRTIEVGTHLRCQVAITAPPPALGLDVFYTRYLDAGGIPVLASARPADSALRRACDIVEQMTLPRDDLREALIAADLHAVVLGESEKLTAIPEYRNLYTTHPGPDWDSYRGVGATRAIPVMSVGEEELPCDADVARFGSNHLVYFTGLALHDLALRTVDSGFEDRLSAAYTAATTAGLWSGTNLANGAAYYWGEGVQVWFEAGEPSLPVSTRADLKTYDGGLASLIESVFPGSRWLASCSASAAPIGAP